MDLKPAQKHGTKVIHIRGSADPAIRWRHSGQPGAGKGLCGCPLALFFHQDGGKKFYTDFDDQKKPLSLT